MSIEIQRGSAEVRISSLRCKVNSRRRSQQLTSSLCHISFLLIFSGRPKILLPRPTILELVFELSTVQYSGPRFPIPCSLPLWAFCACLAPRRTRSQAPSFLRTSVTATPPPQPPPRPSRTFHPRHLCLQLHPLRLELAELHGGSRPDSGAGI